jgi:hypothetical protein
MIKREKIMIFCVFSVAEKKKYGIFIGRYMFIAIYLY